MRTPLMLAMVGVTVCGNPQPFESEMEVSLGEPFDLRIEQSVHVAGTPLRVRFDEVGEDSRCPVDVECVWAGNARIHLTAAVDGDSRSLEVNTGIDPRSAAVASYVVTLERLEPQPTSGIAIARDDYRSTLRITQSTR